MEKFFATHYRALLWTTGLLLLILILWTTAASAGEAPRPPLGASCTAVRSLVS